MKELGSIEKNGSGGTRHWHSLRLRIIPQRRPQVYADIILFLLFRSPVKVAMHETDGEVQVTTETDDCSCSFSDRQSVVEGDHSVHSVVHMKSARNIVKIKKSQSTQTLNGHYSTSLSLSPSNVRLNPFTNSASTCPKISQWISVSSLSFNPLDTTPASMATIYHAFWRCTASPSFRKAGL